MTTPPPLQLSLAQWSFHNTIFAGQMDRMLFAEKAQAMGFEAVEYVSRFYATEAQDSTAFKNIVSEIKKRSEDHGLNNLLIMVDNEGALASEDETQQNQAVENHKKWIEAATTLGCHSLRVNLTGGPEHDAAAWVRASIAGLQKMCNQAQGSGLNIIVENHGGLSSNGALLAQVMQGVNLPHCGTLPDLGNFCIRREGDKKWPSLCIEQYDRYKGVAEMMPWAKGVSAKTYDFDVAGNETTIDYHRMLSIVKNSGYNGYIGIEYEGQRLNEEAGVLATVAMLKRINEEGQHKL
ncbi:sugar phosphate isomerase/epimerase family protein [Flavobacterium sp. RHBU_3]|uniref:sugar phosphate isomerase/epimerase family protein n=1 Tax=Flavobacterium sp. RHBU_3 TaxID=3391184 RepID=UPI0039847454